MVSYSGSMMYDVRLEGLVSGGFVKGGSFLKRDEGLDLGGLKTEIQPLELHRAGSTLGRRCLVLFVGFLVGHLEGS